MGMTMGQLGLRHTLARIRGTQFELVRRRNKVFAEIAAKQANVVQLDAEIAQLVAQAELLEAALSSVYADGSDNIEPRQTFPKRHLAHWGGITRTILKILRAANGGELWKSEIAVQLQYELGLTFATPEESSKFRRLVQKSLNNMCRYGHVERLHAQVTGKEGLWRLKASPE